MKYAANVTFKLLVRSTRLIIYSHLLQFDWFLKWDTFPHIGKIRFDLLIDFN